MSILVIDVGYHLKTVENDVRLKEVTDLSIVVWPYVLCSPVVEFVNSSRVLTSPFHVFSLVH
jgi:hypothetical protein